MLSLESLLLHSVLQSLLGYAVKQKKYILEVLHKARKLMKRAPEVMAFPSSMYLRVLQCLWMACLGLMFAELFCTRLLGGCVSVGTAFCWTCRFHQGAAGLLLPHLDFPISEWLGQTFGNCFQIARQPGARRLII